MSEIGMDTIPLRERAQKWLDNYKAGNACEVLSLENTATIVAVFLNVTDPSKYTECEEGTSLKNENDKLRCELKKLEEALKASENACGYMGSQLTEARGKISAYEFVIRCNGMSGAEVHA